MKEALAATAMLPRDVEPDPALRVRYDSMYQRVYRRLHPALRPLHEALDDLKEDADHSLAEVLP